jgi:hypothetical protein
MQDRRYQSRKQARHAFGYALDGYPGFGYPIFLLVFERMRLLRTLPVSAFLPNVCGDLLARGKNPHPFAQNAKGWGTPTPPRENSPRGDMNVMDLTPTTITNVS